ncbi:DUF1649-domain-containing protein [Macrolepiota fuliginosa MF-IS2]|uniref:Autophagy-related protein 101 n=1 Tax=Macrolepiota fuliginosa MF-IS2 TaxID=1400762 RepID=A0A9P5X4C4_9AGAR|nr:DUF1649-domain-containing protein [Macrolepiota fuliginosa MF-IS2]
MAGVSTTYPTITIDLVLDRQTIKDVLNGVLHSILFHRLFGLIRPQIFEVLDVTMPGVSDPEMEQLVHDKVDSFWRAIQADANRKGQIIVTFSEKKAKKTWYQLYMAEEDVPWEQWIINAELRQHKSERDRQTFNSNLTNTLTKSIHTMLTHTSSERGRTAVPPITQSSGISPFPFKIAVNVGGVEIGS